MKLSVLGYEVNVIAQRRNKNIRMRIVPPYGEIKVSCPIGTSLKRVEQFVLDNISWVQKSKEKVLSTPQSSNYLYGGDCILLKGVSYKVVECEDKRISLTLGDGIAILGAPKTTSYEDKVAYIKRYLKKIAEQTFPPLIAKYEGIIGVRASGIGYRYMTSRWGSCNVKTKHINFSIYAIQKPMAYIEYLVCHELMHLIYPNHGKEFKNAIRSIIPDADSISKLK